jgi:hypothetical protein
MQLAVESLSHGLSNARALAVIRSEKASATEQRHFLKTRRIAIVHAIIHPKLSSEGSVGLFTGYL